MQPISKRPVADTGLSVTEFGLGSATLGGLFKLVPDEDARATVVAAIESGITFIDTAPQYGHGRAEHLVGDGLRDRRDGIVLSTKVGRLLDPFPGSQADAPWVRPFPFELVHDYSYDAILQSFADSRQRLGIATIDMLLVHDIGGFTHGAEQNYLYWKQLETGGYRALCELKKAGLVKAIGLGVNECPVLMDALDLGDWDVFLLAGRYTLLDQEALDPLMPRCLASGTSVIAAAPFNGGALMGNGTWNYDKAPQEVVKRVRALESLARDHALPLGAAALQFALTHPAVCSVLTGPRSPAELKANLAWWHTPVPAAFWSDLKSAQLVDPATPLPAV